MVSGPRWASWNLGIFVCIRCAGIHRNLGVHISKVKSVNLDSWTPVQVSVSITISFVVPEYYDLFERKRQRKLRSNFRRSGSEFIILRMHL
jgi:hypothetical protein